MKYDLIRPCQHCPFRRDHRGFLRGPFARETAFHLAYDSMTFPCHATVDYDQSEDGAGRVTLTTQHCAGALIWLIKIRRIDFNQLLRIAMRLRLFDPGKLDLKSPVFDSMREFIQHHRESRKAIIVPTMEELKVGQKATYVAKGQHRPCEIMEKLDGKRHAKTRVRVKWLDYPPTARPQLQFYHTVMVTSLTVEAEK